jgi:hypothetical protein
MGVELSNVSVQGFASSPGMEICHYTARNFICLDVYPARGSGGITHRSTELDTTRLDEVCKPIRHCTAMIKTEGRRARRSFTVAEPNPAIPGRNGA